MLDVVAVVNDTSLLARDRFGTHSLHLCSLDDWLPIDVTLHEPGPSSKWEKGDLVRLDHVDKERAYKALRLAGRLRSVRCIGWDAIGCYEKRSGSKYFVRFAGKLNTDGFYEGGTALEVSKRYMHLASMSFIDQVHSHIEAFTSTLDVPDAAEKFTSYVEHSVQEEVTLMNRYKIPEDKFRAGYYADPKFALIFEYLSTGRIPPRVSRPSIQEVLTDLDQYKLKDGLLYIVSSEIAGAIATPRDLLVVPSSCVLDVLFAYHESRNSDESIRDRNPSYWKH